MLREVVDYVDQLEMIDVLQRLGVAYHFRNEIRSMLENVHNNIDTLKRKKNLNVTALAFRLLRQHGYNIPTDGMCNFKYGDVEGLLSLYEASFHSIEDEPILDEARDFTSKFLKEFVNKNKDNDTSLFINHALEFPLQWRVPRFEAWWFINFGYERRQNASHALLQFAKLDFNMVQRVHQEELKWWKKIGLVEELRFFRDRLVENFIWSVGMESRPDIGNFRKVMTKVLSFITVLDDVYDVYGTLEELELFTKAIDSWDINAMDSLPHYMKICFLSLYNFVNEVAYDILKENGHNIIPSLKKVWIDVCKAYLMEAKWYYGGYIPRLQEYLENSWISISAPVILVHAYVLIEKIFKKEDLGSLQEYPDIIRSSSIIFRIVDDLGSSKREIESAGDVSKSIQCYMNESGASEADSREHLKCMLHTTWKKLNEEARNSPFSKSFIDIAVNLARVSMLFYRNGDGFTIQGDETKSHMLSLIVQPVPIISK
ncbi:Terpenoid cyclases/protein prenyltransferase alpha-alpha toroid [Sesbania bispinosa]|nr:Terpenoid cyclases/protein prenyltransferase alpha-alpha toroid [Sesbania bispinosa]